MAKKRAIKEPEPVELPPLPELLPECVLERMACPVCRRYLVRTTNYWTCSERSEGEPHVGLITDDALIANLAEAMEHDKRISLITKREAPSIKAARALLAFMRARQNFNASAEHYALQVSAWGGPKKGQT